MLTSFVITSLEDERAGNGLVGCKSPLNSPVVYSTDRSKAVVPVLVLLFLAC